MKLTKKKKTVILELIGFIVTVLPLLIVLIINKDRYFIGVRSTVKISIGAAIALLLILLSALGKLKVPGKLTALAVVFVLSYLLNELLCDLMILTGAALLGEVIDRIFIQPQIAKLKDDIKSDKTAETLAGKLDEALKKYSGRV